MTTRLDTPKGTKANETHCSLATRATTRSSSILWTRLSELGQQMEYGRRRTAMASPMFHNGPIPLNCRSSTSKQTKLCNGTRQRLTTANVTPGTVQLKLSSRTVVELHCLMSVQVRQGWTLRRRSV